MKFTLKYKGRSWKIDKSKVQLRKRKLNDASVCAIFLKPKGNEMNTNIVNLNSKLGALRYRRVSPGDSNYLFRVFFPYMSLEDIFTIAEKYYSSGLVEIAEPEIEGGVKGQGYETNDPLFPKQWILSNTGQYGGIPGFTPQISKALKFIADKGLSDNEKVKIAVLDGGVWPNHHDIEDGILIDGFSVFRESNKFHPKKADHHGTQVAGIICAMRNNQKGIAGINPFCHVMPGHIYYPGNGEHPVKMANGIEEAADRGAFVINLSWKSEYSSLIEEAIEYAVSRGCIVCAAAGNYHSSGSDKSVVFPGNLDQVITVGAHDHKKNWINLNNTPNDFKFGSCYGREVDISAPGIYIPSLKNQNASSCCFFGTSASTAIVSGVLGLIKFVNPNLNADQVKYLLLISADSVCDSGDNSCFDKFGHGFLNAYKAVKMAYNVLGY